MSVGRWPNLSMQPSLFPPAYSSPLVKAFFISRQSSLYLSSQDDCPVRRRPASYQQADSWPYVPSLISSVHTNPTLSDHMHTISAISNTLIPRAISFSIHLPLVSSVVLSPPSSSPPSPLLALLHPLPPFPPPHPSPPRAPLHPLFFPSMTHEPVRRDHKSVRWSNDP